MPQPIDRAAIAADLDRARTDFHHLIESANDDDWTKPTKGTMWNNEELLFHMVFGYMVVQRLLLLVRLFDRLPDSVSRGYARLLNRVTPAFERINFYGSRFAARIYNRKRMAAKLDRVISSLQRSLHRAPEDAFRRGMHYPDDWDPYFRDYMTLEDVYRYAGQHYDHHRRQLTLTKRA
ncbi:DinB family protein [Mycobacterium sp. 663a-19]|uniref:DinB family protein n=1 Tax=Mycobacterium sp. 663a-19 TaxID=2986148 RepID=UPI002D1F57EB|nr:DinB family protein [Mycobacterium sp. 663a-19]MEB3983108.1 DinB family protein [Mycobacterium sp. 663a-19]